MNKDAKIKRNADDALDNDTMRRVMGDVQRRHMPTEMDHYTPAMAKFYRRVQADLVAHRVENPDASLRVPDELPDAEINVNDPYGTEGVKRKDAKKPPPGDD